MAEVVESRGRLDAALDFFVPRFAESGYITLDDPDGIPHIAATVQKADIVQEAERGYAAFPLISAPAGRLGSLHLRSAAREPWMSDGFLAACATRIAQLLRTSLLLEREQRVSLTFQNEAVSVSLPEIAGYRFDAVYQAGHADALIGGDWYDAFALPDGRFIISIGDVQGAGLEAGVAMMNVRQTLRGVAQIHADPAIMLEAADRALQQQYRDRFVTAFAAVIDPVTQSCTYANAGHPPPFLRHADGGVTRLREGTIPLGLHGFFSRPEAVHLHLPPQSMLVLYTDGIIEASRNILEGEQRLSQALRALHTAEPHSAQHLRDAVLPPHAPDDVALLTMHVETSAPVKRWRFDPLWHDAASRVRNEIIDELVMNGFAAPEIFDLETIFAELMGNVVRYAPGTIEAILETRANGVVLHVLDKGPGFQFLPRLPNDLFSLSGRGLYLIAHLAADFTVEHRPGGGSHARIVLNHPERSVPKR